MKLVIKEIAKKAKVSVATISRAMNPETRAKVASDTLKHIEAVIKKYHYTPSTAAKLLRKSSSKVIGVMFPYVENIFYSTYYTHILAGVANSLLYDNTYRFKILLLRSEDKDRIQYDFKAAEGIDGLIITQWFRFFPKEFMPKINIPYIVINDYDEKLKAYFAYGDNINGGKIAAEYLYSLGHRVVGVITGSSWSIDSKQRLDGFKSFFEKTGIILESGRIMKGDFDDDAKTYNAVDVLLRQNPRLSAIFCCNDNMAFAAIHRLNELGIKCPEDISVIGYDDDHRAAGFAPPLTTIHVPVYDIAKAATVTLVNHLKGKDADKPLCGYQVIPVHLIERNSVKAVS